MVTKVHPEGIQSIEINIAVSDMDENMPGWYYTIAVDGHEDIDGGMCTGSLDDAIEMASSQAQAIALMGYEFGRFTREIKGAQ